MAYEILVKDLPAQPALVIRRTVPKDKDALGAAFAAILPRIGAFLAGLDGAQGGVPFARFYSTDGDSFDMEIGIPVAEAIAGDGEIAAGELPAGPAAVTWHVGPYDGLMDAHMAMESWLAETGRRANGPFWEVYWTDPGDEPDPAKWQTELVRPIV